jgi:hypothetical protein
LTYLSTIFCRNNTNNITIEFNSLLYFNQKNIKNSTFGAIKLQAIAFMYLNNAKFMVEISETLKFNRIQGPTIIV